MIEERLEIEPAEDVESTVPLTGKPACLAGGPSSRDETTGVGSSSSTSFSTPPITLTVPIDDGCYTVELHPAQNRSQHNIHGKTSCGYSLGSSSTHTHSPQQSPYGIEPVVLLPTSANASTRRCTIGTIFEEPLIEYCDLTFAHMEDECEDDMKGLPQFAASSRGKNPRKENLLAWFKTPQGTPNGREKWKQRSHSFPEPGSKMYSLFDKMNRLVAMDEETESSIEMHETNKPEVEQDSDGKSASIYTVSDVVKRAKQWRKRAYTVKQGTTEQDGSVLQSFDNYVRRRALTEVPRSLHLEILAESLSILQKTLQMYKSTLGRSHALTFKTEKKIEQVEIQLGIDSDHVHLS